MGSNFEAAGGPAPNAPSEPTVEEKRRRLAELMRRRGAAGGTPSSEGEAPGAGEVRSAPLTAGQRRLHRLASLEPDQPFYNVAVAYRLTGPLDAETLERATRRLAERHGALRTTFGEENGEPVQRVAPPEAARRAGIFLHEDLSDAPEAAREAALQAEISRSMDLEAGPLWRVALFRLAEGEHALTLTMHHIVGDGWSFELILRELARHVSEIAEGLPQPNDQPAQYLDYAAQQRARFATADFARQQTYWAERFARPLSAARLPADLAGGDPADRRAAGAPFALTETATRALQALAAREDASLFMALTAGFAALLHRIAGQEDLLLCTPASGRHLPRSRDVVGYCNNILPLRLDLSGDPDLTTLLRRTRQAAMEAFRSPDVPFEEIAAAPELQRVSLNRILISMDMAWPPDFPLRGVDCAPLPADPGFADFDLSVSVWTEDAGLRGTLRRKTALFGAERIEALGAAWRGILEAMAETPDARLSDLPRPAFADAGGGPAPAAAMGAETPRFALEQRLADDWRAAFGLERVSVGDDFRALGVSSLAVAQLAERLRAAYQVDLPLQAIFRAGTIRNVAALLGTRNEALAADPVAPIRAAGDRPPLFLAEGVGVYYPLAEALGEDQPVYGLVHDLPAVEAGVEGIAAHYVEHIRRVQPRGPYHLGGLSFGGIVAYEVARQLDALGEEVALLALFDAPAPEAFRPYSAPRRAWGHLRNLGRHGLPYLRLKLAGRAPRRRTQAQAAAGEVARLADRRSLRRLFRESADGYRFRPYSGRATLFSLARRSAMDDALFDPALGRLDALLGWGALIQGGVTLHQVEGDHVGMLSAPHVARVAATIRSEMDGRDRA